MNNEEKILALLEQMSSDISVLQQGQAKLEQGQAKLEQGQAEIKSDIADLKDDVADIKSELRLAWKDIGIVEKRILQHEEEYHPA